MGGAEGLAVFGERVGEGVGEFADNIRRTPAEQIVGEGGERGGAREGAQALLRLADLLGHDRLGGEQGVGGDDEADRLEVADPLFVRVEGVLGHDQAETGQR